MPAIANRRTTIFQRTEEGVEGSWSTRRVALMEATCWMGPAVSKKRRNRSRSPAARRRRWRERRGVVAVAGPEADSVRVAWRVQPAGSGLRVALSESRPHTFYRHNRGCRRHLSTCSKLRIGHAEHASGLRLAGHIALIRLKKTTDHPPCTVDNRCYSVGSKCPGGGDFWLIKFVLRGSRVERIQSFNRDLPFRPKYKARSGKMRSPSWAASLKGRAKQVYHKRDTEVVPERTCRSGVRLYGFAGLS
jgi:hypothetical protein